MKKEAPNLKESMVGYMGHLMGGKGKVKWCNYIIIS